MLIGGTGVTSTGLATLHGHPTLRKLSIFDTAVDDAGVPHLRTLASLRVLLIGKSKISEAGAAQLQKANPALSFTEM